LAAGTMRVLALASGGKDSCYNMMLAERAGHEVVALATLLPPSGVEEADSMMYQSVCVRHVATIAAAMQLPHFTATVTGACESHQRGYDTPVQRDEVEDMFALLQRVKAEVDFDAVSSGAIFSDYQRARVENVCGRLGVASLALLWHREQKALLDDMLQDGLKAVLVKVAGAGLEAKHCGMELAAVRDHLHQLEQRFGSHVCGEGGEFETFTLDCPLYKRRIVIEESRTVTQPGDVAYLVIERLALVDKP